jgi:hypothetical protein
MNSERPRTGPFVMMEQAVTAARQVKERLSAAIAGLDRRPQ